MKLNTSVRIVAKEEQRERLLNQIKSLLKNIDFFIHGGRPRKTSLLVSIMFRFSNMQDKELSHAEKEALNAIKSLYDMEKKLWPESQERHSINKNQAIDLSSLLRRERNDLTIKIRQFYPSRKDKAWTESHILRSYPPEHFCEDYYDKVKDMYEKLLVILKDAPADATSLRGK